MKRLIGILILLLAFGKANSQDSYQKELEYKKDLFRKLRDKDIPNLFERVNNTSDRMQNSSFNYPLNDGDFWEYIEKDTLTFPYSEYGSLKDMNFSIIKEIVGDTIMPNGLKYKILKWENCANSIRRQPIYEYQRKDSTGNIFTYYSNEDRILYDFNKEVIEVYPSPFDGFDCRIMRKYMVTGFGKDLKAIDFELFEHNTNITKRIETVVDNFGLVKYYGDINRNIDNPEGNYFGGVINDTTYGYLLARSQKIDWSEFYPLNIGDYWIYEVDEGLLTKIITIKVMGDTLIRGKTFKKLLETDYRFGTTTFHYELLENNSLYNYQKFDSSIVLKYKFSSCIGDTARYSPEYFWRMNEKNYSTLYVFLYPDLSFQGRYFERGIGLSMETFEMGGSYLKGAVINGQIFGDTTITEVENNSNLPVDYILYQNYPNPFNPLTVISYQLPANSFVTLKIYDALGREIVNLAEETKTAGYYESKFDGSNLSSGTYIYRLTANSLVSGEVFVKAGKMMLVK